LTGCAPPSPALPLQPLPQPLLLLITTRLREGV
jgi:hypothetical protein